MFNILIIHPIVQSFAILLAFYVFSLGIQRVRVLHFHQKTVFKWRKHVILGEIALGALIAGAGTGLTMVYIHWHKTLITGLHGKMALVLLPMIIFGLGSGLYMNLFKKKRKVLPIIHGSNNFIVLVLAVVQMVTGFKVYIHFVLGK